MPAKGTYGTAVTVLDDETHRVIHGTWVRYEDFRDAIRAGLREVRYRIACFSYFWGGETQRYSPSEVLEVYFGE